jgi:hypothetical protein
MGSRYAYWFRREVRHAACAAILLFFERPVQAQDAATAGEVPLEPAVPPAQRLFEDGKACLARGDWSCACTKFEQSAALEARPSVWVKVGLCRRHERRYVPAWEALQQARTLMAEDPAIYRQDLQMEIEQHLSEIPTLRIELASHPRGLTVQLDGNALPESKLGIPLPIELGVHQVTVNVPGYQPAAASVSATAEHPYTVALGLVRKGSPSGEHPQRTVGYVVGGVGIAGLLTAGVLGWRTLALADQSDPYCTYAGGKCDDRGFDLRNKALRLQTAGLVVGAVGLVSTAVGVYLVLTAPRPDERVEADAPRAVVGLGLTPGGVLGGLRW